MPLDAAGESYLAKLLDEGMIAPEVDVIFRRGRLERHLHGSFSWQECLRARRQVGRVEQVAILLAVNLHAEQRT